MTSISKLNDIRVAQQQNIYSFKLLTFVYLFNLG